MMTVSSKMVDNLQYTSSGSEDSIQAVNKPWNTELYFFVSHCYTTLCVCFFENPRQQAIVCSKRISDALCGVVIEVK